MSSAQLIRCGQLAVRHSRDAEPAPLLSVVVPVAGQSVDFPQLLLVSSAVKADGALELVVVVDGEAGPAIRKWTEEAQHEPTVVVLQSRGHDPGLARNCGLEAATGKYVCFLDADDVANMSAFLELARLQAGKLAPIGVLGFQVRDEIDAGQIVESWYPASGTHCAWTDIQRRAAVWRFVFDRDLLLQSGVRFPSGGYGEDLLFLSRVFAQFPEAEGLHLCGYTYRVHSTAQLTARRPPVEATVSVLEDIREQISLSSSSAARLTLSSWYSRIALLQYVSLRTKVKLKRRLLASGLVWTAGQRWHSWLEGLFRPSGWRR